MTQPTTLRIHRPALLGLIAAALLAGALPLRAASTGQTALQTPQGGGTATDNGEYVSTTLNTFYRYFIEVPPGLARLVVEVFDPDIGRSATEDTAGRDRPRTDYNTAVTYTLLRPDGSVAATLAGCDDTNTACPDNAWQAILNSTTAQNRAAGHWELRVDLSASNGDDINAIGVRANDGTAGTGGTEIPVYLDSILPIGVNPPNAGTASRSYPLYPYITSGCTANTNDFDYDSDSGTVGSLAFTSRTGAFTQTIASANLSADNVWKRNTINRWTSDQISGDYGIWTGSFTINTYTNTAGINGNYTDIYLGNFQVSGTVAPTANPQPNSFRIYLPTDAGTAPVKPYLEQLSTYSGCGTNDGPNPPVVGQTSCYTVTVRLVNPTVNAITFSAANLVSATVPAAGAVVYAGLAQVSQGTIVSQPAVGGTGAITWNPGTVAAGTTNLLAYRVKVTPTTAGQRIPVTGTPAANGTTAKFVDETGNTTQARATFTFGPLCELAVTQGLLTEAVVADFHASPADGGGVLVEWKTASEAATAGFYVQRWDGAARRWIRVNRELLAAVQAPQGGVYRFVDPQASPRDETTYRLIEVEAGGPRHTYGPFTAKVDWSRPDPRTSPADYERTANLANRHGLAAPPLKSAATGADGTWLGIRQTGLYHLSTADVAAGLGMMPADAAKSIAKGQVSLTHGGQPVAWTPELGVGGPRDKDIALGLFFYGEAPSHNLFTETSVYRLQKAPGLLMQSAAAGQATPLAGGSFPATAHAEKDLFAATVLPLDPGSDYWFWDFLQAGDPTYGQKTFSLDAPGFAGVSGTGGATLTVAFQGATSSGFTGEHHARIALNGTPLGETSWTGITAQQATFAIPAGVLQAAGNQAQVTALLGDGVPYSIFYLNSFDLSYARSFQTAGDTLTFTAGGNAQITVGGFSSSAIRLLDVQDPLHPRWLTGATIGSDGGGFRLSFLSSPAGQLAGQYLAAAPAAFLAPTASRPWNAPSLRSAANRADYLVIAPPALRDAAERLADLRRAQGLTAIVADLDQIMDTFNSGASDPNALRAFLTYAHTQWAQGPRYVALAGGGTVDYRDLLGDGDNLVPPLMIDNAGGLFPSDNRFGDVDDDGLPEVAVGRIPVLSAAELDAYTAKLAAYEGASPAPWTGTAVMAADVTDGGAQFDADSDQVAAQLPGVYTVSRIDLATTPLGDARAQLLGAIGGGTAFVNYMGHGALDRLSAGGLLTSADVPGLTNGGKAPVVTAMTCTINRFAVPGIAALGELLVKSGTGGAAAVWGPAGLSSSGDARLLAERFYHAGDARLGDRILRAITEFRALGGAPDLPRVYDLMGDPALRLQAPPPATAHPSTTSE
jgi:Peptidase family C25